MRGTCSDIMFSCVKGYSDNSLNSAPVSAFPCFSVLSHSLIRNSYIRWVYSLFDG
jgi:hypothetical protein